MDPQPYVHTIQISLFNKIYTSWTRSWGYIWKFISFRVGTIFWQHGLHFFLFFSSPYWKLINLYLFEKKNIYSVSSRETWNFHYFLPDTRNFIKQWALRSPFHYIHYMSRINRIWDLLKKKLTVNTFSEKYVKHSLFSRKSSITFKKFEILSSAVIS